MTYEGKRKVYEGLVLAILLAAQSAGVCESASYRQELRSFHHNCVRAMCRISMWHVSCGMSQYSITNRELLGRLGLHHTMDTHLAATAAAPWLQWLGHAWRMGWSRLPRKLLTAWVPLEEKRVGGRELTCLGRGRRWGSEACVTRVSKCWRRAHSVRRGAALCPAVAGC